MKRFALLGTAFVCAAVLGFGLVVGFAPTAQAGICEDHVIQYICEENHPDCDSHPFLKTAVWRCGTNDAFGTPCNCQPMMCRPSCPIFP